MAPRFAHWGVVRVGALAAYFAALVVWSAEYGVPVQRELVMLWVCGALVCASLGRSPRQVVQLALDWLPIAAVLLAYDFTRGAADSLGTGVHALPMIHFDEFVFGGETPTVWLQDHLHEAGVVRPWDVAFAFVYTSYFLAPYVVAGVLWARDRLLFLAFARRLVSLFLAGLATYIAFPAAPPWMAAEEGLIPAVVRSSGKGWEPLGLGFASLFSEGQAAANAVAAVPSLHAGITALVTMFLWPLAPRWVRPLLALYALAMGLTLIATGEHYFFDVLLGWIYAGATTAAWSRRERRRRPALAPAPESPTRVASAAQSR